MATMDVDEVAHYCYQMLKAYAALQNFKPKRDPRSWEVRDAIPWTLIPSGSHPAPLPFGIHLDLPSSLVLTPPFVLTPKPHPHAHRKPPSDLLPHCCWQVNCEDDLIRHYDRGNMLKQRYLQEDNSSCLRPPNVRAT